jgi:hypothetical protein
MPRRQPPRNPVARELHLPELLTVAQVAAWLDASPRAIYQRVATGSIPSRCVVRTAGRLYFVADELTTWVADLCAATAR